MPMWRWMRYSGSVTLEPPERPEPGDRVVVVRVDERAVDVEDRGRAGAHADALGAAARCPSCMPSANSSTSLALNAGRSSGLARGDEALVDVDLLVDPGRARVAQVGPQRRPGRERAAAHDPASISVHGAVADRRHRLGLVEERAHERDGVRVGAQEVGVGDAARQHEPVVARGVGLLDGVVDRERVALVEVVEALDVAGLERDQLRRAAGLLDGLPRLGQLHLLDAVGGEERDRLALQLSGHVAPLGRGLPERLHAAPGAANPAGRRAVCSRTARGSRSAHGVPHPARARAAARRRLRDVHGAQRDEEERPAATATTRRASAPTRRRSATPRARGEQTRGRRRRPGRRRTGRAPTGDGDAAGAAGPARPRAARPPPSGSPTATSDRPRRCSGQIEIVLRRDVCRCEIAGINIASRHFKFRMPSTSPGRRNTLLLMAEAPRGRLGPFRGQVAG